MLEWCFWISSAGILYTYLGYPAILWGLSRLRPAPVFKGPCVPNVSVLIAAHNEARTIRQKLENCLCLDYPFDRVEILVGTDGCTDETDAVISQIRSHRVRHYRLSDRAGKPAVLNRLVSHARGEVLVFTDARQLLAKDALRRLLENLRDPMVGAVSGELIFTQGSDASVGQGLGTYWRYEKFIRRCESQIGSTIGATGALYAIRKRLWRPLDPQTILDDVKIPLDVVRQGYRVVFEPAARVYDRVARTGREEFRRKVRTLAGNYRLFIQHAGLLRPGSPVAWQFWSHKVLRTAVPFWLAIVFLASTILPGPVYKVAWGAQMLFYALAILGWRMAYVFCLLNVSAVVGLFRFLRGGQPATWENVHV